MTKDTKKSSTPLSGYHFPGSPDYDRMYVEAPSIDVATQYYFDHRTKRGAQSTPHPKVTGEEGVQ